MKSKLAIASFVLSLIPFLTVTLGLAWMFIFGNIPTNNLLSNIFYIIARLFPTLGTILGIISLFLISKRKLEGKWFAIIAIGLSIIWFSIMFYLYSNPDLFY